MCFLSSLRERAQTLPEASSSLRAVCNLTLERSQLIILEYYYYYYYYFFNLAFLPLFFFFFNFFKVVYLFLRQRETEHERGRVKERETQNPKQAPGSELSAQSPTRGSNPRTARS